MPSIAPHFPRSACELAASALVVLLGAGFFSGRAPGRLAAGIIGAKLSGLFVLCSGRDTLQTISHESRSQDYRDQDR